MIAWLEKALVLAIHDRQLAEHGGSAGVRDEGLLESALARPQQLHAYGDPAPDLADLAEREFAAWLRARLRLAPRGEAHEPRKPYRAKPRGARRVRVRLAR